MVESKMIPVIGMMFLLLIGAIAFSIQGVQMQNKVAVEEEKFHDLQAEYFTLAKSVRDSAETGSELNDQLIELQQYPSILLELKLVGIGKILTGIFLVLVAIVMALMMMPVRLGAIIKKNK